jgi:hypothetical protein
MLCKRQMAVLFFVLLAFAVATPATLAQTLSNSEEPGSVLVFPLFQTGTVSTGDQGTLPRSSFEISVICPTGSTCADGQDVDIHLDWVCPGNFSPTITSCAERDFVLNTTVNGTILFNASSTTCTPGPGFQNPEGCGRVQTPPCSQGYLIAWVVDEFGNAIKFDGLIGDSVLRESGPAATAYNAIPIQAGTAVATGAAVPSSPQLAFDGASYQEVTGKIIGSVRYDVVNSGGVDQDRTDLILLTLDTHSNVPNYPTFVNLNFYNEIEILSSESTHFTCWGHTGPLNSAFGLNSGFGLKGLVQSTSAVKVAEAGITDTAGPVTLLGLVITRELNSSGAAFLRDYTYPFFNDSVGVPTTFVP